MRAAGEDDRMTGTFIGIKGTGDIVTLWIEDSNSCQVSEIKADHAVFFEQILGVFPGANFQQKVVEYQVNEEGMLTQFRAAQEE